MLDIKVNPYILKPHQSLKTSKLSYNQRLIHIIEIQKDNIISRGEIAPLKHLSIDNLEDIPNFVQSHINDFVNEDLSINYEELRDYPSITFGLETVILSLKNKNKFIFDNSFSRGQTGIPINGLIWMSDIKTMLSAVDKKIKEGFKCIKIKVGALNIEDEINLIKQIRSTYPEIELRLDANGGLKPDTALKVIEMFYPYNIHSIEQPIQPQQHRELKNIINNSPIPICLDEELIHYRTYQEKEYVVNYLRPQYLILKPSLAGGMYGCDEWIQLANKYNVKWWATSALESNIGLNSIAQWVANKEISLPQGLGTGLLYSNNFDIDIKIKGTQLWRMTNGNNN